jgi:flavin reductase (DIM6/NTAB) family NADH-FMN oxidoreductase RutF
MSKTEIKPEAYMMPLPAIMLSCCKPGGRPNIITLAWVGVLCSEPPLIGAGIRPQRYSYDIVKETGEFVVNVPGEDQARATDYCGYVSGREKDKFKECDLTPVDGSKVKVPLIRECPMNIECVVRQSHMLGTHELFIGEIVAIHVDDNCIDRYGKLVVEKLKPFIYVPGASQYVGGIDRLLGTGGFSVRRE